VIWNNIIGTLYCHDAKTGDVRWKVTPDYYRLGFSKTFAPLVAKGMVVSGIGGGEYGVRGFLEARNAETGKRVWKTYTIPGPGEAGHDTWPKNNDLWEHGGAPTWITGSFDPELNLIYWTTGNAGPWSSEQRPGDNLYCCSVLALDADTGKIKWHFQMVPNDDWDYDCNVTPILTEIDYEGKKTPIIAMAVKNGFLFVLDRRNGKFLKSAKFFETEKDFWAKGLDPKSGRPIETGTARPKKGSTERVFVAPSALGAANWWGMALYPAKQWMIIVANETGNDRIWDQPVEYEPGKEFVGWKADEFAKATRRTTEYPGRVCAYDLTANPPKKVWEAAPELEVRWGGPLVTGGGLVFTGTMRGYLQALDADTGKRIWQFQTGSGIMAHPVTFSVDGKQYVAIVSGKGGVANPASLSEDFFKHMKNHNSSGMVFAFALP
jgi:alcohol dehydrogenase (cytochrome c)